MQEVLPCIDGVRTARRVAQAAEVELELALKALQFLAECGVISTLPVFQFSNIYTVTDKIGHLAHDYSPLLKFSACVSIIN